MFPYDAKAGTLGKAVQVVNAMPPNAQLKPWAADIHLTPNGKFLYASERTTSTLSVFKVDAATGLLTQIDTVPTEQQPRAFEIDPTGKYPLRGRRKVRQHDQLRDRSGERQADEAQAVSRSARTRTGSRSSPCRSDTVDARRQAWSSRNGNFHEGAEANFQHKTNNISTVTYGQSARSTVGHYGGSKPPSVAVGQLIVSDDSSVPVFTGAELALADALILLMKVMAMHGIINPEAIDTVFADLEGRYRSQQLNSAAAMAEYLRHHATGSEKDISLQRLRTLLDKSPEGSA